MNAFTNRFRRGSIARENLRLSRNWWSGTPGPDSRQWIIRPDDLLVLDFDLHNLQVEAGEGEEPAKLIRSGSGPAYLIVTFPPQNIIEKAYFTTVAGYPVAVPERTDKDEKAGEDDPSDPDEGNPHIDELEAPPIPAIISGWSRLVFRVKDDDLPIFWTLEAVLEAMGRLELSVAPNALPPPPPPLIISNFLAETLLNANLINDTLLSELEPKAGDFIDPEPVVPVPRGGQIITVARARRKLREIESRASGRTGAIGRNLLSTVDKARAIKDIKAILVRPKPDAPSFYQTALELPYRLIISPNRHAAWVHAQSPFSSQETGHMELWHTRLGIRRADGGVEEGDSWLRTIRAIWTKDYRFSGTLPPTAPVTPSNSPFRASLDRFDRHNIVHLSSNFGMFGDDGFYEPPAIDVDFLSLSALGAWLDSRGTWDFPQPKGLSVEEWRHLATLGRDHYVRVVYAGFLFPWGHRASLIKITERQFHDDEKERPAYLRQRMFLIVREPLKTYRNTGLVYDGPVKERQGERYDLMMPFSQVRITTLVSPLLDPPETDAVPTTGSLAFWPYVGGEPFLFDFIATDTAGNEVEFAMPLIFVNKVLTDRDYIDSPIPKTVANAYEKAGSRTKVSLMGQRLALAKSKTPDDTLFAVESLTFGVEVPLKCLQEDAKGGCALNKYDTLDWRQPRFFPVVRQSKIDVPALQSIARTDESAAMVYESGYLKGGFGSANAGEVFLAADKSASKLSVSFSTQGDRSGALVTPDMSMNGISRLTGPIAGKLETASAGTFDPGEWFGAIANAKLFGVFALSEILYDLGFDDLDMLPRFIGKSLNQVEQLIADIERMEALIADLPGSLTADVTTSFNKLLNPENGLIPALFQGGAVGDVTSELAILRNELGTLKNGLPGSNDVTAGPKALIDEAVATLQQGIDQVLAAAGLLQAFASGDLLPEALDLRFEWRPRIKGVGPFVPFGERNLLLAVRTSGDNFKVLCSLDDFKLELVVIELDFEHVQFRVDGGGKPEIDVLLKDNGLKFTGPLSFIETLRSIIPLDGFSDPPDVSVTAEGIKAGYSVGLPNIAVGVFSLENLSLAAGFSIPFLGPPLSTWFQFCTRENPSRLTVSLFGGGFFFGFTVDPGGLVVLEGAIEFGAAISVDFGVASGGVSAMAGLYFKIEGDLVTLAGYFRLRGEVEALGIVSVSIELYLELRYESGSGKCVGTATISIEIDVTLFSTTIEITATKKFAGANSDPTFAELMDVQPDATSQAWETYCLAFA